MSALPGQPDRPLRIGIVGSGPAAFYAAEACTRQRDLAVEIDLYERLPVPYGLVRHGVAPDHQKIKSVARAFEKTARDARVRWLGNVEIGGAVRHEELLEAQDQLLYATGCAGDRKLGVPGESLAGSHAATAFVGWYNGHPDYEAARFDLSCERAVVVGAGNVALDVVRMLVKRPDDLAQTDIAGHALAELRASRVREVFVVARRGAEHAAFGASELEELVELDDVALDVDPAEIARALATPAGEVPTTRRKLLLLAEAARTPRPHARRRVCFRFLRSPTAIEGRDTVESVALEVNDLVETSRGPEARGTGARESVPAGLVLRSVRYAGVPIPGVPFDDERGVIPNQLGRVVGPGGAVVPRVYCTGWIQRGPSGVIGTNKSGAQATVEAMLEDARRLAPSPPRGSRATVDELLRARGVRPVTFAEWEHLDALELAAGQRLGRVRDKLTSVSAMLRALEERSSP
ncbi:MAG: FAD-dependent oxidoreductase [Polyangiaceae bacterium]|nr:FAD-dependent oxidoreductase [Polyangiaceae bacterium]